MTKSSLISILVTHFSIFNTTIVQPGKLPWYTKMTNTPRALPKWVDIQQHFERMTWVIKKNLLLTVWTYFQTPDWCRCGSSHGAFLWLRVELNVRVVVHSEGSVLLQSELPEFMDMNKNVFRHRTKQIRIPISETDGQGISNTWHQEQH